MASLTENIITVSDLSSSLQLFSLPDYLVFLLMLIVCAAIGVYFGFVEKRKKSSNNEKERRTQDSSDELDYLVGGRKMQVFPISMSLVASWVSGISLLGSSTEIYLYGTQFCFMLIVIVISGSLVWFIFLPVFMELRLTSTYEYLEMRFDRKLRIFGSVLFSVGVLVWLPIVIYVPALAFNQVTGVNIHIVTPVVCLVCIFYTCVGGIKAVVWTDVIQTIIMFGSILVVIIKGTHDVGGLGVVWSRNFDSGRIEAPSWSIDPTVRYSVWSVFIGGLIYWANSAALNQVMMQRFLSVPDLKAAKKSLVFFILGILVILGSCMYNGLLIYATYHDCDPLTTKLAKAKDQLVPLLVMDVLGVFPGMPGLFVAGVFSAALSSLSTGLNSLSAVILEDFIKPNIRAPLTEKQISYIMRSSVVIVGIVCVGLVFVVEKLGSVMQLSMSLGSISSGPAFGIFLIGMCIPWFNGKSALTGGIISWIIMAWIIFNAQSAMLSGDYILETKPLTTEGCTYLFNNATSANNVADLVKSQGTSIYHMSYLWYTGCGTVICLLIAALSSFAFGTSDPEDIDPALLAPFVRRLLKPRKYLSVRPDVKELENVIRAYDSNEKR